ncbi:hypothetical protein COLO4_13749 [Corchorus olitorius]|uniref:Uncharacterized protein n=1 Tax=Corchorus olitorius TaxID=93759 RepID=A0A1R3JVB8_9ROSI|nr:hypothetical protein COLO4_13749 [Corchorus olitorius]
MTILNLPCLLRSCGLLDLILHARIVSSPKIVDLPDFSLCWIKYLLMSPVRNDE